MPCCRISPTLRERPAAAASWWPSRVFVRRIPPRNTGASPEMERRYPERRCRLPFRSCAGHRPCSSPLAGIQVHPDIAFIRSRAVCPASEGRIAKSSRRSHHPSSTDPSRLTRRFPSGKRALLVLDAVARCRHSDLLEQPLPAGGLHRSQPIAFPCARAFWPHTLQGRRRGGHGGDAIAATAPWMRLPPMESFEGEQHDGEPQQHQRLAPRHKRHHRHNGQNKSCDLRHAHHVAIRQLRHTGAHTALRTPRGPAIGAGRFFMSHDDGDVLGTRQSSPPPATAHPPRTWPPMLLPTSSVLRREQVRATQPHTAEPSEA